MPEKLSGSKIERLSITDLHYHLSQWGVEVSSQDLKSELRAKLERKIVESEKDKAASCKQSASPGLSTTAPGQMCTHVALVLLCVSRLISFWISF